MSSTWFAYLLVFFEGRQTTDRYIHELSDQSIIQAIILLYKTEDILSLHCACVNSFYENDFTNKIKSLFNMFIFA